MSQGGNHFEVQLCYFQSCDPLYGLLEVHVSNSTCSMFYLLDWLVMCHSDCVTVLWLLSVSTLDPRSPSSKKHPQEHRTNQREDVRPRPKGAGLNASGMGLFSRAPSLWQGQRGNVGALLERHRDILNPRMSTQPNNQPHFVMCFFHYTPNMYQNGKCRYVYIYICRDR